MKFFPFSSGGSEEAIIYFLFDSFSLSSPSFSKYVEVITLIKKRKKEGKRERRIKKKRKQAQGEKEKKP